MFDNILEPPTTVQHELDLLIYSSRANSLEKEIKELKATLNSLVTKPSS